MSLWGIFDCGYYYSHMIKPYIYTFFFFWFLRGRIKAKISTLYAIKCQACCIANTVTTLVEKYCIVILFIVCVNDPP